MYDTTYNITALVVAVASGRQEAGGVKTNQISGRQDSTHIYL